MLTALSASLRRTLPHIFSKSSILCDCVHCPLKLIPRAPPLDPAPAGGFPLRGAYLHTSLSEAPPVRAPFLFDTTLIVLTALSASLRRTLPHIFSKSSILCDCVHCPLKLIPRAPPLDPAPAGGFPLRGATPCVVGTAFLLYTPDFTPSPHSSSLLF